MKEYKYYNIFKKPPNKRNIPYFVGYFGYNSKAEAILDGKSGTCSDDYIRTVKIQVN